MKILAVLIALTLLVLKLHLKKAHHNNFINTIKSRYRFNTQNSVHYMKYTLRDPKILLAPGFKKTLTMKPSENSNSTSPLCSSKVSGKKEKKLTEKRQLKQSATMA